MGLRDTYAYAIQTAKGKFQGNAEERDGKLHFKGTVATEAEKNEIWTAIKTIPTWQKDIVAGAQLVRDPGRRGLHRTDDQELRKLPLFHARPLPSSSPST